jgi:hypothetical protein
MSGKYKIGLIAFGVAVVAAGYFAIFGIRTTRLDTLQQIVQKNVRTGESPQEVIDLLKGQNLDPSGLVRPEAMHLGGQDYANQNLVMAVRRYSARALLWKEMIYLVFVFDENRKMVGYDVFPVYDSL